MKFSAITLFPEMFDAIRNEGVVSRAINKSLLEIEAIQLRNFAQNSRKNVDAPPAGGGDGMVIMADIAERALQSILTTESLVILTTPKGKIFSSQLAKKLSQKKHL
ncbi:MAG: tRNA (guanosine(37)-N1)-methyltransferase TrmD, partial [Bdellovibrionota bacterium]